MDMIKKGVKVSSIAPELYPTNIINSVNSVEDIEARWQTLSDQLKQEYPLEVVQESRTLLLFYHFVKHVLPILFTSNNRRFP